MTIHSVKANKLAVNYRNGMRRWGETYCQDCVHARAENWPGRKRLTYFCLHEKMSCCVGATKTCDNARPRKEEASNE
jgi:hypothetical protein